jgi:cytidine deaminase
VGAAGLLDDGRVVVGCNVENASYGMTLCAECGMVSSYFATRAEVVSASGPHDRDAASGAVPGASSTSADAGRLVERGPASGTALVDPASAAASGTNAMPDGEGGSLSVGGGRLPALVAVAVTDPDGNDLSCCGRCRQVLFEAGGAALVVNERPITEWLPGAFGPADLDA